MTRRSFDRTPDRIRPLTFTPDYLRYPEGSVLVELGHTKVVCSAMLTEKAPSWMSGKGLGWLTAEYSLLPYSTATRTRRESSQGKPSGRTQEIQRLIGRCLRSCVDLSALGENTVLIDCDVLQADGGTRTAAINGGFVALAIALDKLSCMGVIDRAPLKHQVAAISCGILDGQALLDLDYDEDSQAAVDMNIVMNDAGSYIEVQGTAEHGVFTEDDFSALRLLARAGVEQVMALQRSLLGDRLERLTGR